MSYFPTSQACNEPNSESPLSPSYVAAQNADVAAVGQQFLSGNSAVYDLVAALGGNLPGMVPASPPPSVAPVASATSSTAASGAASTVGGSTQTPVQAPGPVYAAPGVLAAPFGAPAMPKQFIGGVRLPTGVYISNAVKSMVQGCNPAWAGPTLGAQPVAATAPSQPSAAWMWGLGLLALSAFVVFGSNNK